MPIPLDEFVKQLEESGVLATASLDRLKGVLPEELAQELVRQQLLTEFQAEEACKGNARSLVLGNYVLLEKIGQGGMGQVFKARHRRMDRIVAVKLLSQSLTKDAASIARFEREVKAAARISHPNIVAAYDADCADGVHFLVMELVDGSDLSASIKSSGPFSVEKAFDCIIQAARGLEAAHAGGIVHRDIKPANLLLDKKGTVKILDMGVARLNGETEGFSPANLTSTGEIVGTVDFMAPEQALNTRKADARADIYALGCTLYYLLTGKTMYGGETVMEKFMAHREEPIPLLCAARNDVSEHADAVFKKMVTKTVADRYQTMTEVIAALEGIGPPPSKKPRTHPSFDAPTESGKRPPTHQPLESPIELGSSRTQLLLDMPAELGKKPPTHQPLESPANLGPSVVYNEVSPSATDPISLEESNKRAETLWESVNDVPPAIPNRLEQSIEPSPDDNRQNGLLLIGAAILTWLMSLAVRVASPLSNFVNLIRPVYAVVSSPTWYFSAPGKILGLSVPWRVGAFTGLSLTFIVSVVGGLQVYNEDLFGKALLFSTHANLQYLGLVAALLLAFSVVTGLSTQFWLMGFPRRFPLIDNAWNRGIAELQIAGIDLAHVPVFLVCGIADTDGATSLMQASGLRLGIRPTKSESRPLLWFTAEKDGEQAIFLFLCTCCQTSLITAERRLEIETTVKSTPADNARRDTIRENFHSVGFDDSNFQEAVDVPRQTPDVPRPSTKNAQVALKELQYVCRKLRTARQPFGACNGLVSTVHFQTLKADESEGQGKNLGQATRSDLNLLTCELGLRTHVLALVHGLDEDPDFRSYFERMREFRFADVDRRLGKGISTWAEVSTEVLKEVAHCSCDAFERLVYKFFSSTQSLKKADNCQLFRYMANIRGPVEANLTDWLVEGFATHENKDEQPVDPHPQELPQFAGCYFVAAERQTYEVNDEERLCAHAPGLFERLYDLKGEIEWTQAAADRDTSYTAAANLLFLMTLAGIVTIAVGLFVFWGKI